MKKELITRKIGNVIEIIFSKNFDLLDESMKVLAIKDETTINLDLYNTQLKKNTKTNLRMILHKLNDENLLQV